MKTLIVGIDGGDLELFEQLRLPRLGQVFREGLAHSLTMEKFLRGWPVALTGQNAEAHGGLYLRPKLKGHLVTDDFGIDFYTGSPGVQPLWQALNQRGSSVGFLEIPTTFPAPRVEGFMVSGGGGGRKTTWPAMGYPVDVQQQFDGVEYLKDVRLTTGTHRFYQPFLADLSRMEGLRAKQFIRLLDHYQPDVGFVCFVGPDRLQHALFKNLEALLDPAQPDPPLADEIREYYLALDAAVGELLDRYAGANLVFISDHGFCAYRQNLNLNHLLERAGLLEAQKKASASWRERVRKTASRMLPQGVKNWMKDAAPELASSVIISNYKVPESIAFSIGTINGIYLNDERFPGGRVTAADYDRRLAEAIAVCEAASTPEFPLAARPYRPLHRDSHWQAFLPDVVVDFAQEAFPVNWWTEGLLTDNPLYRLYADEIPGDCESIISGIHRPNCLFAATGPDVREAGAAFENWTLDEFYEFVLRLQT